MQTGDPELIEQWLGPTVAGFLANEALREAVLGLVAILMVLSLVIYMWRTGANLKERMEHRLGKVSVRPGMDGFRRNFSVHRADDQPRRNGNRADAFASAQSASDLGSGARPGCDGRDGFGVGTFWTSD